MASEELTPASVMEAYTQAHFAVHFANRALVKGDWSEPTYVPARQALDEVMLLLSKAKWIGGRATGTLEGYQDGFATPDEQAQGTQESYDLFQQVIARADAIKSALDKGEALPPFALPGTIETKGTETLYYDDVPIVPGICPIVVLKGSNHEMGRQYAKQVLEIYGPFVFAWHARRPLAADNLAEIAKWEAELRTFTPEILDFARGWAEGATASGVEMDYTHALAIWTGITPPAKARALMEDAGLFNASADALRVSDRADMCSGACAWGDASADGKLVLGATHDGDCTFVATIVAYPDEGNSFIYTPFAANGTIPIMGHFYLGGHPGINNKGLAYVHHGGAGGAEPPNEWGYGVRRGPMTFHTLQYANTAKEALAQILTYPVGDMGVILGTVGGFWADSSYGFSIEVRAGAPNPPHPVIREQTYDRQGVGYNVLYANNNALSPHSGKSNAPPSEEFGGYKYELEAGWYTADPKAINSSGMMDSLWRRAARDSGARNRYGHRMLVEGSGGIDVDYMDMMYHKGGEVPDGAFEDLVTRYEAGEEWSASMAHRMNGFTVIAKPDNGNEGIYRGCIGPASRGLNCKDPGHGYYYYDETAAFWEVTLAESPEALAARARELAQSCIEAGSQALSEVHADNYAGYAQLRDYLDEATQALAQGSAIQADAAGNAGDAYWSAIARAVRLFTRAQVRSNQVHEAINESAGKTEMLSDRVAAE